MATKKGEGVRLTAPPVICGLVGALIGIWAAANPNEPYAKPLLTYMAPITVACEFAVMLAIRKLVQMGEERHQKKAEEAKKRQHQEEEQEAERKQQKAEAGLKAAIEAAEGYRTAESNPAHQERIAAKINQLQMQRIDLLVNNVTPTEALSKNTQPPKKP